MKASICGMALICCLTLQACSSRPREFTPALAVAPASQTQFDAAYADCHQLLVAGKLDLSGRRSSAAGGVAAGAGTAAVRGGAAAPPRRHGGGGRARGGDRPF